MDRSHEHAVRCCADDTILQEGGSFNVLATPFHDESTPIQLLERSGGTSDADWNDVEDLSLTAVAGSPFKVGANCALCIRF